MLAGLDYAMAYLDDIEIKNENTDQHRKHVHEVFKRINEYGFKQKPEKCKFLMERMKYLGQIIDQKGIKPVPERAKILKNMSSQDNVTKLQAYLRLESYIIYMPEMYEPRVPLDELLKKGKKWYWTKVCKKHFKK